MKNAILWNGGRFQNDENNTGLCIDSDKIVSKVDLSQELVFMFTDMAPTPENEKMLNDLLPKFIGCGTDYYALIALPELAGITIEQAGDSELQKDMLCYFHESKNIASLNDCESVSVYGYHDGSNWKEIWFDESTMTETEVLYDDETGQSLDRYDGSNWSFQGRFSHGKIYLVSEVDGEKVTGTYLLYTWSQYQGSLPEGELITAEKRQELLKED